MKKLYEILGIDPGSDEKTVKLAYRSKSQQNHPDKGGSDEAFHEISVAYAVLSDPDRRKKYDETGDIEEPNHGNPIESTLAQLFEAIISQNQLTGNIIDTALSIARAQRAEIEKQLIADDHKRRKFEKLLNRVTSKSEINLFAGLLAQKIDGLTIAVNQANERIEIMEGVIALLKDYDDTSPVVETALGGLGGLGRQGIGVFQTTTA